MKDYNIGKLYSRGLEGSAKGYSCAFISSVGKQYTGRRKQHKNRTPHIRNLCHIIQHFTLPHNSICKAPLILCIPVKIMFFLLLISPQGWHYFPFASVVDKYS